MNNQRNTWTGFVSLLVLLLLPLTGVSADKKTDIKKPAPSQAIAKLIWLAGNWRLEKNGRLVDEQWMVPAGGAMFGMGRTVVKGKVVEFEFLQIREGPSGSLFYVAQSSGQEEATFVSSVFTNSVVVFENPEHDFPQKISYTLQADGSLLAAVEGSGADGALKRIEYAYRRVVP